MPLKKILLARPKRKNFLLTYQSGGESSARYLKVLHFFEEFLLYTGIPPKDITNTNKPVGNELSGRTNILTLSKGVGLNGVPKLRPKEEYSPDLIVTSESFGAVVGEGLSSSQYDKEITSLKNTKIPFIANALIGDMSKETSIKSFYNAIRNDFLLYKENGEFDPDLFSGIKPINYPIFPPDGKIFFNRTLVSDGLSERSTYKRNKDTPLLPNGADYIHGFPSNMFTFEKLAAQFYIKICNDAGSNHIVYDLKTLKPKDYKKFYVCQSDFFTPWQILSELFTFESWIAQNNIEKYNTTINPYPGQRYYYPKSMRTKADPLPLEKGQALWHEFMGSTDYLICADTQGWKIFDDRNITDLTWNDVQDYIKPYNTTDSIYKNIYELRDFFKKENGEFASYKEMASNSKTNSEINTPYSNDKGERPTFREFFEQIYQDPNQATINAFLSVLEIDIQEISDTDTEKAKIFYEKLISDSGKVFKIHLYSPLVGNIYKINKLGDAGNQLEFTQVKRVYNFFGGHIDYSVFDIEQLG